MQKFECTLCGYIYDPALVGPDTPDQDGAFEDVSENWVCPLCGAGKEDFEVYED
uniref:Rubredoxin n=1 Tax=Peptoniphilus asaccharolyticus TaxID=1258 RepID=RUBR_PEPAS|nr:RecName: Full=Rubredoxin; Short=Rd [Peptoniphilus asaccharolyticus]